MGSLPPELLAQVLSHLSLHERVRAGGVCKQWRSVAMARSHWDARMEPVLRSAPPLPDESVSQRLARVARQKRLWDQRERVSHPEHVGKGDSVPVALACTRESVVALCDDGRLRAWHVQTLQLLGESTARHEAKVFAMSQASPNWRMLASCDEEGSVMVWDAESLRHLLRLHVPDVVSASMNDRVVVAWSMKQVLVTLVRSGTTALSIDEPVLWTQVAAKTGRLVVALESRIEGWRIPCTGGDESTATKVFVRQTEDAALICIDPWSGSMGMRCGASMRLFHGDTGAGWFQESATTVVSNMRATTVRHGVLLSIRPPRLVPIDREWQVPWWTGSTKSVRVLANMHPASMLGGALIPTGNASVRGPSVSVVAAADGGRRINMVPASGQHVHGSALAVHTPYFFIVRDSGDLVRFSMGRKSDRSPWRSIAVLRILLPLRAYLRYRLYQPNYSMVSLLVGATLLSAMLLWLLRVAGVLPVPYVAAVTPSLLVFAWLFRIKYRYTRRTQTKFAMALPVAVLPALLRADGWLPGPSVLAYFLLTVYVGASGWQCDKQLEGSESKPGVRYFFLFNTLAIPVAAVCADLGQPVLYLVFGMGLALLGHASLMMFCLVKIMAESLNTREWLRRRLPRWMLTRDLAGAEFASVMLLTVASGASCVLAMLAHAGVATGVAMSVALVPACVAALALYTLVTASS